MVPLYLAIGIALGLVAMAAYAFYHSFFRVEEGHVAILSDFGAAIHEPGGENKLRMYPAGMHSKRPWQRVHSVSLMEQILDLSGKEGGTKAMAEDGTILRLDSKLRFRVMASDLYAHLFSLRDPMGHIRGLFTCLLRNEIANFGAGSSEGSYHLIRSQRRLLNEHIEDFTKNKIGQSYGVKFNAVDLTDILPPDELADALNAVMNAKMHSEAQLSRAEAECQQRVLSSKKGVEIATARAEAAETEAVTLVRHLESLDRAGTLSSYVERRTSEVYLGSKSVYLKHKNEKEKERA